MNVIPIQVTDEGVFIPKVYLHDAGEVEVEMTADYVIVKPKTPATTQDSQAKLHDKPLRIYSPRLANPKQAVDFKMEVAPERPSVA